MERLADRERRVAGGQRIDRVRRQYNQWVANQTLEDYALRFTAKSARRWSAARVANTALGAISFVALEAVVLAPALEMCFGMPRPVGYLMSAVAIIPLVTHGITLISRFQLWA